MTVVELLIENITEAFIAFLIAAIPIIGKAIIDYTKNNSVIISSEFYRKELERLVEESVGAVQQTYVERMKKENAFTREAQITAFTKARDKVLEQLNEAGKEILENLYEDFHQRIEDMIEHQVFKNKEK